MRPRPPFVFALGFAFSCLVLAVGLGCDATPEPARAELEAADEIGFAAASVCTDACAVEHCENVVRWIDEHESLARWCLADCEHEQVACLLEDHAYAGLCGECEHVAAECRSAC